MGWLLLVIMDHSRNFPSTSKTFLCWRGLNTARFTTYTSNKFPEPIEFVNNWVSEDQWDTVKQTVTYRLIPEKDLNQGVSKYEISGYKPLWLEKRGLNCPRTARLARLGITSDRSNTGKWVFVAEKIQLSMDWFKGKSTGNHRFSH